MIFLDRIHAERGDHEMVRITGHTAEGGRVSARMTRRAAMILLGDLELILKKPGAAPAENTEEKGK